VQGEDLDAQEVLARREARRQVEVGPAVVADNVVDAPGLGARVKAVLPDLEPVLREGNISVLGCTHT
jgi:hypothetical protein